MKYSKTSFNNILSENDFRFKKKFGQNFITDENVINKIVDKSDIKEDTLVIEVGPGIGSLTYHLAKKAKNVVCFEIDENVKTILEDNLKEYDNVEVIYKDFLKVDIKKEIAKYSYKNLYVVANLPYYITTPIILKIIEDCFDIDKMVFMVQKEVGNRFKAEVGTKEYNSLSIYLQYYFSVKKLMDVKRNVFMPVPNVDSIVVEFSKKQEKKEVLDEKIFFKLVRDSFKQKRKTLKNNLKGYDLEVINRVLNIFGYNLSSRAEQLPINVFIEIANELKNVQK